MAAGPVVSGSWPAPVKLGELARGPVRRELIADEAARARIGKALDLVSLDALEAAVTVQPWLDGAVLQARWRATLTQTCVVTLDPLTRQLQGEFTVRLVPAGSEAAPAPASEIDLDPEADDPPDLLESDEIDVAAFVIEHLALEIDPFPRTPGVAFEPPPAETPASPFAVLHTLRKPDSDA